MQKFWRFASFERQNYSLIQLPRRFLRGSMNNFYETLGVGPKATKEEIERIYKLQLKHFDPTLGVDMDSITLAYQTLSDPEKRFAYDLYIS